MGIKETFLADEWKNLPRLPYAVGTTIIVSGLASMLSAELQQQSQTIDARAAKSVQTESS